MVTVAPDPGKTPETAILRDTLLFSYNLLSQSTHPDHGHCCRQPTTGLSLPPEVFSGCIKLFHCPLDHAALRRDISAHPTAALFTEHRSLVDTESCPVDQQAVRLLVGHGPFPEIEPHQVGAFGPDRTNGRHAVAQKVEHVVHVSVQIVDQLLEPLVAP